MKIRKFIFYTILALAALAICPIGIKAVGLVTSPILINDALRSHVYEEELTIVNTQNATTTIGFSAEGDIKSWATFYQPDNLTQAITQASLLPHETKNIIVQFNIPADAGLGKHTGLVSVLQAAAAANIKNESNATVTQKVDREVTIIINTQEKINFNASVIPETYDLVLNQPLKIRVIYDNQGNTDIKPDIYLRVQNGDQVEYSVIFPYPDNTPAVKPHSLYEVKSLEIPTAGLSGGQYTVTLDFYNYNALSLSKNFYFSMRSQAELERLLANFISQGKDQWPLFSIAIIIAMAVVIGGVINHRRKKSQLPLKI